MNPRPPTAAVDTRRRPISSIVTRLRRPLVDRAEGI